MYRGREQAKLIRRDSESGRQIDHRAKRPDKNALFDKALT